MPSGLQPDGTSDVLSCSAPSPSTIARTLSRWACRNIRNVRFSSGHDRGP